MTPGFYIEKKGQYMIIFSGSAAVVNIAGNFLLIPHTHDARAIDGTPLASIASPLKLFEYMASGRPIIASALEPIKEILSDGTTGLLIPPGDSHALGNAIETLLRNPLLGEELAKSARLEARKYTWEARGARILTCVGYHANGTHK